MSSIDSDLSVLHNTYKRKDQCTHWGSNAHVHAYESGVLPYALFNLGETAADLVSSIDSD